MSGWTIKMRKKKDIYEGGEEGSGGGLFLRDIFEFNI